jgi:SAM-dependent methyltransferase
VSFDYHAVPGDYQYRALRSGHSMQRFWHGGKLVLIDHLIRPHLSSGSRFLEIGCGAGNLLLRAAVRGSYPVAVDLSMRSLTFVRDRLLEAAAGERLPLATASFDCVLLSEVIEHLVAPQNAVSEAARVLKPGARLLVTTPNYRSLWPAMEWGVDQLKVAPKMAGAQHITRFNPDSLRTLLLEADLRIEYFGTVYGFSPFLAMVSVEWARRRLQRELDRRSSFGMILVAMGVKN